MAKAPPARMKAPMMYGRMLRISWETTGVEEATHHSIARREQLERGRRVLISSETQRLAEFAQKEAPRDTGIFAEGLYSEMGQTLWGEWHATIGVRGEHAFLLDYIVGGTRPHEIPTGGSAAQIAKGYPLTFYWEKGPGGPGIYHFWSVQHSGTAPNPFHRRARIRWQPWAQRRIRELGMQVREARER